MIENVYIKLLSVSHAAIVISIPYFRRFLRFLALPYCYFRLVNWAECKASKLQVLKDLFYIFFALKYFPDNYSLCRLWEKDRSEWIYYYGSIYDPYQRSRLRKKVQKKEYEIIFQDKNICYKLCQASNLPLPRQYGVIEPFGDYKKFIKLIFDKNEITQLMIKPVAGKGGKGILLASIEERRIFIRSGLERIPIDDFVLTETAVAQDFVVQHPSLSAISPSVNTIRIVTLLTIESQVLIIGALIRFGVDNAYVDNTCSGGVAAGINLDSGTLKDVAYDNKSRIYSDHPTSKIVFKGYCIPYWEEVLLLAQKIQEEFSFYKLLGSDIAITAKGPVVIEINGAHDNVGLEQKCGPILLDPRVRYEFKQHNLLINKISEI